MEQFHEQNSMQISAAANGIDVDPTCSRSDETDLLEEYFNSFPHGYRFCPSDEELIEHYLKKKVNNETLPLNRISEINLYSKDPSELAAEFKPLTETEWYFFTPRQKKYPNGSRPNRATPEGYWKPTGTDKAIPPGSGHPIGYKKTLDFYEGKHPGGRKTDWKMHEYKVKDNTSQNNGRAKNDMKLDDWVLCKLYNKKEKNGEDAGNSVTQATVIISQNEASVMPERNNEFEDIASQPNPNYGSLQHEDESSYGMYLMLSEPTAPILDNDISFYSIEDCFPDVFDGQGLTAEINTEISYAISNLEMGKRLFDDQEAPSTSVAGPVDVDCFWHY
ncbi:NAC domain - like 10 [Theobroma cacao]|nr:NAC domain - like 10 [Theobroma cacao]